jgi:hypothetical protein
MPPIVVKLIGPEKRAKLGAPKALPDQPLAVVREPSPESGRDRAGDVDRGGDAGLVGGRVGLAQCWKPSEDD